MRYCSFTEAHVLRVGHHGGVSSRNICLYVVLKRFSEKHLCYLSAACLTCSRYWLFIDSWLIVVLVCYIQVYTQILTLLVTVRVFRTSSGPPLCSLIPRTSSSPSSRGRSAVALAVAIGRGAAGRGALVAGRWRSADSGQAGTFGGALLGLFGLRFAVLLPAEDRRHVVQRKDLCSRQKHTFWTFPTELKLKIGKNRSGSRKFYGVCLKVLSGGKIF